MPFYVKPTLEVPPAVELALLRGTAMRKGSVVWEKGRIIAHLRECSAVPSSSRHLAQGLSPQLSNALNMACPAVSMLNLGATVAFGAATLHKLNKIDKKLDMISEKLDIIDAKIDELNAKVQRIAWAVDIGFATTLRSLGILERYAESEIIGQLTSAAQSAWSCQFLEPGNQQRMIRIENARALSSVASERLTHIAMSELSAAKDIMISGRKKKTVVKVPEELLKAMMRLRQAAVANSLNASVMAESGDLYTASAITKGHSEHMFSMLKEIGSAYLDIGNIDIYGQLVTSGFIQAMPAERLDIWVKRFDPEMGGALGLMDALRSENCVANVKSTGDINYADKMGGSLALASSLAFVALSFSNAKNTTDNETLETASRKRHPKGQIAEPSAVAFFDLMDSCWEDVDRLNGYAHELDFAATSAISWQDYRQALMLSDASEDGGLVFLNIEDDEQNSLKI